MFKLIVLMILLLFSYSVVNGFNDNGSVSADIHEANSALSFHQVGYFKHDSRHHILTVRIPATATREQVEQYARDQTEQTRQQSSFYFFEDGSAIPVDRISRADNLLAVNDLLYNTEGLSKWRFAFMRKSNGSTRMVDCAKYPESDLCRT